MSTRDQSFYFSHSLVNQNKEKQWESIHPCLTPVCNSNKSETTSFRMTPHSNRLYNSLMSETIFRWRTYVLLRPIEYLDGYYRRLSCSKKLANKDNKLNWTYSSWFNRCCCTDQSVRKLLNSIFKRSRRFTMDVYVGSVGFSEPSQIRNYAPKQIPSQFRQRLKNGVSGGSNIF